MADSALGRMCVSGCLLHSQPLMMNNVSRPQAARFKQNNNKKTSQTKHSPKAALEKAVGLHASPGFPSCKTKPPVKEETVKTPEPSLALSKKAFLTVQSLSEWLEAADCQPGQHWHGPALCHGTGGVRGGPLGHRTLGSLPAG